MAAVAVVVVFLASFAICCRNGAPRASCGRLLLRRPHHQRSNPLLLLLLLPQAGAGSHC